MKFDFEILRADRNREATEVTGPYGENLIGPK